MRVKSFLKFMAIRKPKQPIIKPPEKPVRVPDKTIIDESMAKRTVYDPEFGKRTLIDPKRVGENWRANPRPADKSTIFRWTGDPITKEQRVKELSEGLFPEASKKKIKWGPKIADRFTKPTKPDLAKLPPGKRLPPGTPGLAAYKKPTARVGRWWSRLSWKGKLGAGLVGGTIVGMIAWGLIDLAFEQAHLKMGGELDLAALTPQRNQVTWISAPFVRTDEFRDLPNTVGEDITIIPPQDGVFAFGFSLSSQDLNLYFTNDVDINMVGIGMSDWLCELYGSYIICWSTTGGASLTNGQKSILTLKFHGAADEIKKLLSQKSGIRSVYLITK